MPLSPAQRQQRLRARRARMAAALEEIAAVLDGHEKPVAVKIRTIALEALNKETP